MRIADKDTTELRFAVGTRVECNCGTWEPGIIVRTFYHEPGFGRGRCVPYQVRLDAGGKLIYAPHDQPEVIRRLEDHAGPSTGGQRSRRRKGKKKAPVLPSGTNEPIPFKVKDPEEVKISAESLPGSPHGVDIISISNCDGGRWVPARVQELRWRQDDWCPGIYCAYAVEVHRDVSPEGTRYATPVREDDERCIRAAPAAPPRAPPRFAVGTRVECNGGPRGWRSGVVAEIWPESPSGVQLPYRVDLDGPDGASAMILHDVDEGIRAVHVVEWGAYEAWDDAKGVEAVYDLLVGGTLKEKKSLPKVGLCGDARDVDALSDAVAKLPTEARRVKLMLEQILSTAEAATPLHPLVGMRVRVQGLSGSAELNGKCGTAVRFAPERERYEVRLGKGGKTVGVRDANLSPAKEPMVTCPICMEAELTDPLGPALNGPGEGTATVTLCCGKVVCGDCHTTYITSKFDRQTQKFPPCPFCREPTGYMDEDADKRLERDLLKRRATQGDAIAMYNLSASYDMGIRGLTVDYQASLAWAALASMVGGHVRAMNNVGYALKDGEGMKADPRRAVPWFARGAVLGHVSCIWALGKAYAAGHGVARDYEAAKRWLKRGKEMGDGACANDLRMLPPPHGEAMEAGNAAGPFGDMTPDVAEMLQGIMARTGMNFRQSRSK